MVMLLAKIFLVVSSYFLHRGDGCRDSFPCTPDSCSIEFLKPLCKSTCGLCPKHEQPCRDLMAYCPLEFCRSPYTAAYCRKRCGYCEKQSGAFVGDRSCGRDKKYSIPAGGSNIGRIISGTHAAPNTWIWQIALYYKHVFRCGGSLIALDTVLTAAHCIVTSDPADYYVMAGETNRLLYEDSEQGVDVAKIALHQGYDGKFPYPHDIAVLKLERPVKITNDVGLVCLPTSKADPMSYKGDCYASGWGLVDGKNVRSQSMVLNEVKLPPIAHEVCKKRNIEDNKEITPNMVCAGYESGPQSICIGDSGGPLVCRSDGKWFLTGVSSWVDDHCNATKQFSVFTKVSAYAQWIDDNM